MLDLIGHGHSVLQREARPPRLATSRILGWCGWGGAMATLGAVLGGPQGAVAGLLAVLVGAITLFDAGRSASTERRFVAEEVLIARPAIAVHAGWDLVRRERCVLVMIEPGVRWGERAREMIAQPSFRALRSGERYAEGMTGDGRVLWAFAEGAQDSPAVSGRGPGDRRWGSRDAG